MILICHIAVLLQYLPRCNGCSGVFCCCLFYCFSVVSACACACAFVFMLETRGGQYFESAMYLSFFSNK